MMSITSKGQHNEIKFPCATQNYDTTAELSLHKPCWTVYIMRYEHLGVEERKRADTVRTI
jgi:hypothetical protein